MDNFLSGHFRTHILVIFQLVIVQDRMWRKNRSKSKTLLNIISNCKGTDLNRNFAYNWGELDILK